MTYIADWCLNIFNSNHHVLYIFYITYRHSVCLIFWFSVVLFSVSSESTGLFSIKVINILVKTLKKLRYFFNPYRARLISSFDSQKSNTFNLFFKYIIYYFLIVIYNFYRASPNKDEAKHGRHDAHKHHDTMGEVSLV